MPLSVRWHPHGNTTGTRRRTPRPPPSTRQQIFQLSLSFHPRGTSHIAICDVPYEYYGVHSPTCIEPHLTQAHQKTFRHTRSCTPHLKSLTKPRTVDSILRLTASHVIGISISGIGSSSASSKYVRPRRAKENSETENLRW